MRHAARSCATLPSAGGSRCATRSATTTLASSSIAVDDDARARAARRRVAGARGERRTKAIDERRLLAQHAVELVDRQRKAESLRRRRLRRHDVQPLQQRLDVRRVALEHFVARLLDRPLQELADGVRRKVAHRAVARIADAVDKRLIVAVVTATTDEIARAAAAAAAAAAARLTRGTAVHRGCRRCAP